MVKPTVSGHIGFHEKICSVFRLGLKTFQKELSFLRRSHAFNKLMFLLGLHR